MLLLSVLALLTANILVLLVASHHNDEVCRRITIAVYQEASKGVDDRGVFKVAQQEILDAGYGGFFIDPPKLVVYKDATKDNRRRITVGTQCLAKLPVRRLIATDDLLKALTLKRTYIAEVALKPDAQSPQSKEPANTNGGENANEKK